MSDTRGDDDLLSCFLWAAGENAIATPSWESPSVNPLKGIPLPPSMPPLPPAAGWDADRREWAAHTAHGKDRPRKHLAQEVQAVEPAHRQRLNRGDNIHPLEFLARHPCRVQLLV